jgi:spermidine/putrescine ABC transporter ATP-binding subunit
MQAASVRLQNVGKRYDDHWVVCSVSLDIKQGEFFTFLGPSGCGKTTLLRIVAGFIAPDQGMIFLDNQPMNHVPPWRRDIGLVFQNYALWPHLSVFENVAFGLRERKVARGEIARRVAAALQQVDLAGAEKRRPSQLSGGQQQRVALARTLVIQPRVLLLDEPLSNLDAKLRIEMRLELLKLQRDLGLTTIYVTHDQEEALAMSTRIAVMREGKVIQQGKPREIYEKPVDKFVAAFLGHANLFSGRVISSGEGSIDVDVGGGLAIRASCVTASSPPRGGGRLFLSVRPEAVELKEIGTVCNGVNHIEGQVIAAAYRGSLIEYEIGAGDHIIKAHVVNPKGKPLFERNQPVCLRFAPDDVTLVNGD